MEKISALVTAYNEEDQLPNLFYSLEGVDEVILVDHESTDQTAALARKLGATVITQPVPFDTATQEDREKFKEIYGFDPKFEVGSKYFDWVTELNKCLTYCTNDWVFWIDCDERVTWDLEKIRSQLPGNDQMQYKFIHTHNPDGSPSLELTQQRLFRKSVCKIDSRIHAVVVGGSKWGWTDDMKVDHWQKPKDRTGTLPALEYAVIKDGGARIIYYLGREYSYYGEHEKVIQMLSQYMTQATYRPESADAWLLMARSAWQLHRGDDARKYCLNAIATNPDFREALLFMGEITGAGQSEYWKRYGGVATNKNVLFITI